LITCNSASLQSGYFKEFGPNTGFAAKMLQCKKYTEASGRASFIVCFAADFCLEARQSQQSWGYTETEIAAVF